MAISTQPPLDVVNGVYYPSSDNKPMAETDIHVLAIILLFEAVRDVLQGRLSFYAACNVFWYYEEGNNRARCSPDVMVVRGVENRLRRSFRSWEDNNAAPCAIFEVTSKKTWRNDLGRKRAQYAQLGVREYFLFDPEALYLKPPLRGFRLKDNVLEEIQHEEDGSLFCEELGLRLIGEGQMLRLIDLKTGEFVLTRQEQIERQRERADQLAAENERLKQLLATKPPQKNGGSSPK